MRIAGLTIYFSLQSSAKLSLGAPNDCIYVFSGRATPSAPFSVWQDDQDHENELGDVGMGCRWDLSHRWPYRGFSPRHYARRCQAIFHFSVEVDQEDWLYFGGSLVAIGAAHQFDEKVRDDFATGSKAILNGGEDKNSLRDAAPAVAIIAGTGLYAAFIDDRDGYRETWSSIEAGALSGATAEVLGYATGRERPDATTSPNEWGKGGDSFPSLHSTVAFAVGTVFAESGNDEIDGFVASSAMEWQVPQVIFQSARMCIGYRTASQAPPSGLRPRVLCLTDEAQDRTALQFQPVKNGWIISCSIRTH